MNSYMLPSMYQYYHSQLLRLKNNNVFVNDIHMDAVAQPEPLHDISISTSVVIVQLEVNRYGTCIGTT